MSRRQKVTYCLTNNVKIIQSKLKVSSSYLFTPLELFHTVEPLKGTPEARRCIERPGERVKTRKRLLEATTPLNFSPDSTLSSIIYDKWNIEFLALVVRIKH